MVKLSDRISELGFRNTGQLILVNKDDKRALKFIDIDSLEEDFETSLKLSSHPGRAIIRGPDELMHIGKGHDGEQVFFGKADNALKVKFIKQKSGNYYIQQTEGKEFWLEVPRNQHDIDKAMWFRTKHSDNDDYFGWVLNKNGSIQSCKKDNLVLGFGISPDKEHWSDLANHMKFDDYKIHDNF